MAGLSVFLAQNALKVENTMHVASKRFIDEDGNPVPWEIGCITTKEDEQLRQNCTKRVPIVGKRGQFTQETDFDLYLGRLAARCTIFPNLSDAELQSSYGVMGADALLKTMLLPGEYTDYLGKVQEVNGFDTTFEDKVDEAKN